MVNSKAGLGGKPSRPRIVKDLGKPAHDVEAELGIIRGFGNVDPRPDAAGAPYLSRTHRGFAQHHRASATQFEGASLKPSTDREGGGIGLVPRLPSGPAATTAEAAATTGNR